MTKQSGVNICVDIETGKRAALEAVLDEYQQAWFKFEKMPFEEIQTVHFCRWVILDEIITPEKTYPERLFFESNFDGTDPQVHIKDLMRCSEKMLDRIYSLCIGYPTNGNYDAKTAYLIANITPITVFYNSTPLRNLKRIKDEDKLRTTLWSYLNSRDLTGRSAKTVADDLREYVSSNPEFNWLKNKDKMPSINIPGLLLVGATILVLLPFLIVLILVIRIFYEPRMKPLGLKPGQINFDHMNALEKNEDIIFQNQFSQMLYLNTSIPRQITIRLVLKLTTALGKYFFINGQLMGIPTIHFARWILMDDGKHMFFTSNFDGSWQQYLGDFIDKSGWGLSAIWSNSEGFPKTKFLFTGGAYNEEQFLAWSRYYQVPTQFWFSAYPSLSTKNIINNSYIRRDVMRNLNEAQAKKFLRRF